MVSVRHSSRRAIGCQTSSPHSSARSTAMRSSASAGQQRRLGRELLEAAHDGPRAGELLAGLERQAGHRARRRSAGAATRRASAEAARRPRRERPSSPARAARWRTGASRGRRRASRAWDDPMPCSSSSTSATPRPTSGPIATAQLVEHWRFTTVRDSTADELGAVLRNLLELRGIGLADLDASIVSSTVPAAAPRVGGDGRALSRPRDAGRRPRHQDRDGAALRQPARDRARPPGQRRGRLREGQGRLRRRRLRHRGDLRPRLGRGRVPRRHHHAGRRDLDGGADQPRRRAAEDRARARRAR